jgi:hypothetical protein
MKFTFRDVEYRIEFQYDTKKKGKKVRNYTFARIVTGERENQQIVAEGQVVRFAYDQFDKEEARKWALDTALINISEAFVCSLAGVKVSPNHIYLIAEEKQLNEVLRAFAREAHIAYYRRPGGLDYERAVRKGLVTAKVPVQAAPESFLIQTA